MNNEEIEKYRNLVKEMIDVAFKMDQLGYLARNEGIDYKAKEYFDCAIELRNAANKLEYVLA